MLSNPAFLRFAPAHLDLLQTSDRVIQLLQKDGFKFHSGITKAAVSYLHDTLKERDDDHTWRVRLWLATEGTIETQHDLDDLFPNREQAGTGDQENGAEGSNADGADSGTSNGESEKDGGNQDSDAGGDPEVVPRITVAEWEARFPIFGTQGTLRQYKDFLGIEKLHSEDEPDRWLELCHERAELLGLELQGLQLVELRSGTGYFRTEAATLTKLLGVTSFDWILDHGALTVTFTSDDGKLFQLSTPSLVEPLQPLGDRSSFFEPYLRAAILQGIYWQLGGDEHYDAIADLESFHLTQPSPHVAEETTEVIDEPQMTVDVAPAGELTDQPRELQFDEIIHAFLTPDEATTVAESPRASWRDRALRNPAEFYAFFDNVVPLPDLTDKQRQKLENVRSNILANLDSEHRSRALPTDGVTVVLRGGQWMKRTDWEALTGADRVELHPAPVGSTALASVIIHYADNVTLETLLEHDGFLSLSNGIDILQRTALEAVLLRCLEQEVTQRITIPQAPASPISPTQRSVISVRPDAPTLPAVHTLHEPDQETLEHRAHAVASEDSSEALEAIGYRKVSLRRVWAGYYRDPKTGEVKARQPRDKSRDLADQKKITLITGTRAHPDYPDDSDRRLTVYTTIRGEHRHAITVKKLPESS